MLQMWARTALYSDSLRDGPSGDAILVEWRPSAPVQITPGVHPASWTMVPGLFPGGKADGAWRWTPAPPSSAEVKERKAIRLIPLYAFKACYGVNFTFIYATYSSHPTNLLHFSIRRCLVSNKLQVFLSLFNLSLLLRYRNSRSPKHLL